MDRLEEIEARRLLYFSPSGCSHPCGDEVICDACQYEKQRIAAILIGEDMRKLMMALQKACGALDERYLHVLYPEEDNFGTDFWLAVAEAILSGHA